MGPLKVISLKTKTIEDPKRTMNPTQSIVMTAGFWRNDSLLFTDDELSVVSDMWLVQISKIRTLKKLVRLRKSK